MQIPYTKEDSVLQTSWPGIRFKSPSGALVTNKKKLNSIRTERRAPMEGWVKANFDGAAGGNLGASGAGVFL